MRISDWSSDVCSSDLLVEMAIADAVQRRVNVLVEGTMRNPDVVAKTLRDFRGAGFETDARALAVSPELSSLGILQRYAAQKESRGVGRMTPSEAHQAAVTGMLATRSEERRVGEGCVSPGSSRWSPYH